MCAVVVAVGELCAAGESFFILVMRAVRLIYFSRLQRLFCASPKSSANARTVFGGQTRKVYLECMIVTWPRYLVTQKIIILFLNLSVNYLHG